MTSLSGSAFLQALGWAIAGSLWQMAILWTVYQLCFGVWRNIRASVKTGAATVLQFVGFGWFVSSLVGHYWKIKMMPLAVSSAAPAYQGPVPEHHLLFYVNRVLAWSEHYLPYLSGAYLLVLAFLLVRVVKAYRHVHEVRTEGLYKIDPQWRIYVQQLAHRIGIHRDIRIWLSDKIDIPATMGYLKPLILLPIASFNHLTSEQVEAIILHELAHIKRNDYLLNLILTVMDTVLFFNPFAQLIARHIRTERENSCDDFVLQFRYNPHVYASALLSLAQPRLSPELAMAAVGKTDLLDRIKRIMNVPAKPMNYGQKLMALLITAGILASLAWLTPENIEHKPILNSMAVLLPVPPVPDAPVPDAPVPPLAAALKTAAKARTTHPCPAAKVTTFTVTSDADASWSEEPSPEVVVRLDSTNMALHAMKLCLDSNQIRLASLGDQMAHKTFQEDREVYLRDIQKQQFQLITAFRFQELLAREQQRRSTEDMRKGAEEVRRATEEVRQDKAKAAQMVRDINLKLLAAEKMNAYSYAFKIKGAKAKVLDQQQEDDETGISADQPGWQAPARPFTGVANDPSQTRLKVFPTAFYGTSSMAGKNTFAASPYRERYTLYTATAPLKYTVAPAKAKSTKHVQGCPAPPVPPTATCNVVYATKYAQDAQDAQAVQEAALADQYAHTPKAYRQTAQSPAVTKLVSKLESDGYLAERGTVRIVVENNTLTINGEQQPDGVYSRYKECLDGKALVILSTGKVIQVTVH